jgi:hypothetical protein
MGAQKTSIDRDIALQYPSAPPAPVRVLLCYEIAFDRQVEPNNHPSPITADAHRPNPEGENGATAKRIGMTGGLANLEDENRASPEKTPSRNEPSKLLKTHRKSHPFTPGCGAAC